MYEPLGATQAVSHAARASSPTASATTTIEAAAVGLPGWGAGAQIAAAALSGLICGKTRSTTSADATEAGGAEGRAEGRAEAGGGEAGGAVGAAAAGGDEALPWTGGRGRGVVDGRTVASMTAVAEVFVQQPNPLALQHHSCLTTDQAILHCFKSIWQLK